MWRGCLLNACRNKHTQHQTSSYWKTGHWAPKKEMETTIPLASGRVNGLNP
jgi:hypothetical protein